MKFLFLSSDPRPIHAKTLEERPIGGGPSSIIRLSQELSDLGHEVYVVTNLNNPPPSKPTYINLNDVRKIGKVDVLIAVRGWWNVLFHGVPHRKCLFWTGDSIYNPKTIGIGDRRVAEVIHGLLPKSQWLGKELCQFSGYPLEKTWALPNGVYLPNFEGTEPRNRNRLIYSSTPARGLDHLLDYFKVLKRKHPKLELHVFSSFDRLSETWPPQKNLDEPYRHILEKGKGIEGCYLHNSVLQKELAREFMRSAILAYPTDFAESCCNTTLEAQAAGCAIVTTELASLPETVGDAGILIKGFPANKDYEEKFIGAVDKILSDDSLFHRLSSKGLERAKTFGWAQRAHDLLNYLKTVHGIE